MESTQRPKSKQGSDFASPLFIRGEGCSTRNSMEATELTVGAPAKTKYWTGVVLAFSPDNSTF